MSYFIPRNNRIYSFLISLPQHMWYLSTILVLIFCIALWFVFLYLPLERSYLQLHAEYRELTEQHASISNLEQEISHLQHTVDSLGITLKTQVLDVPSAKMSLNLLMARSIESGLSLLSWVVKPATSQGWYINHHAEFELQGNFEQLLSFSQLFIPSGHPLRLQEIKITNAESKNLKIQCLVSVLEVGSNAGAV